MKNLSTLVLLIFALNLAAQPISNSNFAETEIIPCPYDSNELIKAYKHWEIYQTLDDTWAGTKDSSHCISLSNITSFGISLLEADLEKPIFVRYKYTDDNKYQLTPDYLYTVEGRFISMGASIRDGVDCPENICTGLIFGIEIPDSTGTGTFMRWYTDVYEADSGNTYFEVCTPTEYFSHNYLREFIMKITLGPDVTIDKTIRMTDAYAWASWSPFHIREIIAPASTFADTSYEVPVYKVAEPVSGWYAENYLLLYTDYDSWPSSTHPSYVEGRPEVNTPDPQVINLIVNYYETFIPQPFAFLRGALVEGSDSIRHEVNLVNNGGDLCMSGIIDMVFDGNSRYIHHGGHVSLEHPSACMMFRNGAALEVGDGTTFQYGRQGKGILALRPGSTIRLGKGSTLLIDNLLWLQGIPTAAFPDPQIYMELNPGSKLIFGEHARIINTMSEDPSVRLNLYMNGGVLDDRLLSPESRSMIRKIYPQTSSHFSEKVRLLQNPVGGVLRFTYEADKDEVLEMSFFDLQGRSLGMRSFSVHTGINQLEHELHDLPAGMYLARCKAESGEEAFLKFIKN